MANYRPNVAQELKQLFRELGPIESLLDYGAGNGWMLNQLLTTDIEIGEVTAVDVQERAEYFLDVTLYDGDRLPFDDQQFEATMAVDVLHHCPDPHASLRDAARVTRKYLVIKDHTYGTPVGFAALSVLDEVGNRKFGIPSRYRYQKDFTWDDVLREEGFEISRRVHPLPTHDGVLAVTNRLQCLSLYERTA